MNRNEILRELRGKEDIQVIAEGRDILLLKHEGYWNVRTFMGTLFFTDEELASELEGWNVIDILY